MSTPSRPAGSEPYIVAMANQADRANRPTKFIIISSLLILACLVYMLFGVRSYIEGNSRLDRMRAEQRNTDRLLAQIEDLNNRNPDLLSLYPPGEKLMPEHLRQAAAKAFADNPNTETEPSFFSPSDTTTSPLETTRGLLNNNTVQVRVNNNRQLPLEDILLFIQTALEHDPSDLMFLSDISLRPSPQGWQATSLEFRRYSFNRDRRR